MPHTIRTFCCFLAITVFLSCNTNKQLKQESAESAIKEFVTNHAFTSPAAWGEPAKTFDVTALKEIEPLRQFSETEADVIVRSNFHELIGSDALKLKFTFKQNMEKQWVLASVSRISDSASQAMIDRIQGWQNLNIVV